MNIDINKLKKYGKDLWSLNESLAIMIHDVKRIRNSFLDIRDIFFPNEKKTLTPQDHTTTNNKPNVNAD